MQLLRTISLAAALLIIVVLVGCGNADSPPGTSRAADESGPVHVHGLGVNPKDGALFIASHTGLFRLGVGESRARRVGDVFQDTMAFTVIGPDPFLGSGHPHTGSDLPPFLGLIRSDDAGRSWKPVSLLGETDFHVLRAEDDQIYGYGSDWRTRAPQLLASNDAGRTWQRRPLPEPLLDIAVDPSDPQRLVAAGEGAMYRSADGGRRWSRLDTPGGAFLAWPASDRLVRVGTTGDVSISRDAGTSWQTSGAIGGEPSAFLVHGDTLYASLHDGLILTSRDHGATWAERSRP